MFNLVEKRRWYFILSAFIIIPGLLIMAYSWATTGQPFHLSIDFVGGSIYNLSFIGDVSETQIRDVFAANGENNPIIQQVQTNEGYWLLTNPTSTLLETDAIIGSIQEAFRTAALEGNLKISYNEGQGYLLSFSNPPAEEALRSAFASFLGEGATITSVNLSSWSIRASYLEAEGAQQALDNALAALAPIDRGTYSLERVTETIGSEVTRAAFGAVLAAAVVITGFMVLAFRQVPNAFRYGVCAIAAMLHDILVVMGIMSLMGLLFNWEVDALFLTAILTVVGFSVQDTIVVFDRIRENIPLRLGEPYETIVNRSLWETIHRSLATQLNAFFIMVALLIFGGESVRHFVFILFIGLLTGSYSSLFTAVPMLVSWEKGEIPFVNQKQDPRKDKELAEATA
jgi:preprotein translocase SecF subunit